MTQPDDIARVVVGLTDAQMRAIRNGYVVGSGKWPVRNALASKGLASSMPFRLTPLGLAVKAHLETRHDAG